jgi:hypothetical protein
MVRFDMEYFSRVNPNFLLHGVYRMDDLLRQDSLRVDISDPANSLQISALHLKEEMNFKPHYHLLKVLKEYKTKAQESWVVVSGSVRVSFYDVDNTFLGHEVLVPGDISYTFDGGHGYEIISPNTLVYEFKSGPYIGASADKNYL